RPSSSTRSSRMSSEYADRAADEKPPRRHPRRADRRTEDLVGRQRRRLRLRRLRPGRLRRRRDRPGADVIEIRYNRRPVVTTAQAAEALGIKPGSLRARINRHDIQPATHLDPRTPLYYPEDLGLETPMNEKTWTLSTNVTRDSLSTVLADLDLGWLV